MKKQIQDEKIVGTEKEFTEIFRTLCNSRSSWQVWADLMSAWACSLANVADRTEPGFSAREKEYRSCISRLGGVEKPAKMFAVVEEALTRNPDQDFLGKLYMTLELSSHWKGQFFTPYDICRCMAEITISDKVQKEIAERGWISISDSACGAGATLIAAANTIRRHGANYQTQVLFVAQDIDRVVGQMCYIQLSLLGCPGYVVIADTIVHPVEGELLMPQQKESQEFWFTPFFFRQEWHFRRQAVYFRRLLGITAPLPEKKLLFHFDFEKGEYTCQNF